MLKLKREKPALDEAPPLEQASTFDKLLHNHAIAAFLLIGAALAAFLIANSAIVVRGFTLAQWYESFWHFKFGFTFVPPESWGMGTVDIKKELHLWVNDGLMSIFFFIVGLEIKRELLVGELASFRRAMLPIAAAIGGMAAPALVYAAFNFNGDGSHGWGIPMATDIAFSAGLLGLLSGRVPSSLAVFLVALAIVDDLGSVLVIAVFYTERIDTVPLLSGMGLILTSLLMSSLGVRNIAVFLTLAGCIWLAFLESGVHATIAGVLLAFTVPADARYHTPLFVSRVRELIQRFSDAEDNKNPLLVNARQQRLVRAIEAECLHVEAPLQRIENKLHAFTAFVIMPVFAFANSGVVIQWSEFSSLLFQPVTLGVICGLVFGKQLGIMGGSALVVLMGLAELPKSITWKQLYGLSWLGGIGFTMSLFIGQLAFVGHDPGHSDAAALAHLKEAKIGTLTASLIAASCGLLLLYLVSPKQQNAPHAPH